MIMSNRTFDALKWADLIGIPAAASLYSGLAQLFGWPYAAEVTQAAALVCAFLGTVLGISNAQYYKQYGKTPTSVFELDAFDVEEQDEQEKGEG